jgi:transposase/predicted transcriptional regulator
LLPLELLAAPSESRFVDCALDVDHLTVHLAITTPMAACPLCGAAAGNVHSRYIRRLADLPCLGRAVQLRVTVRRFSCPQPECPQHIFAERLPGFAEPHARTTSRLRQAHESIGSALGGEAGSRLTIGLSMATSPDTLLRRVKQIKDGAAPSPRLVGIDDWAWCKGQRYGTIVVDLERGDVVDLLPDRDAETVKKWLGEHPGVELVSRDRWSAYAQASAEAAPKAQQVADRWHLLKNLREAIERLFERQSTVIGEALKAAETPAPPAWSPVVTGTAEAQPTAEPSPPVPSSEPCTMTVEPGPPEVVEPSPPALPSELAPEASRRRVQRAKRQRRLGRFEQVHQRHRQGHSERRIARELGMSRKTVGRYLRRQSCPDWSPGRPRRSTVDAHREWIDARLAEGLTNVVELHRQLTERGFQGSYGSVWRYVSKRLSAAGKKPERGNTASPSVPPPPSAKQLSFEWVRRPEKRKPAEQARLDAIRARSDELKTALDLGDEFAELIRKRSQGTLSDWLVRGEACLNPELRRFAEGLRRDEAAVLAAVTQPWSNGPVEGHVNRLKTIKRQMYGRAGFVLLRARVVRAP